MNDNLSRYVPWAVLGLAGLYLLFAMMPAGDPEGQMRIQEFATLPVLDRGRVKPVDTYARTTLMSMNERQEYRDADGHTQPAVRWLLDTLAEGLASYYENVSGVVFIFNDDLVKRLGLTPHPNHAYPAADVLEKQELLKEEVERVHKKGEKERTDLDWAWYDLFRQLMVGNRRIKDARAIREELRRHKADGARVFRIVNDQVLGLLRLERREGLRYSWNEVRGAKGFVQFARKAESAEEREEKQQELDLVDRKTLETYRELQRVDALRNLSAVTLVPPAKDPSENNWLVLSKVLLDADLGRSVSPYAGSWEKMIRAYGKGDAEGFNKALDAYRQKVDEAMPGEARSARLEVWFNQFAPFFQCTALYVVIFLLACLSWVAWPDALSRSAFLLVALVLVVHTAALGIRMYLQGRPPVTNLYSSAVFIGLVGAVIGLVLESLFRNGVGSVVAAVVGFPTLLSAHLYLSRSGDTLEMMQAVLDTNFWLATHVTCVTIGYASTFVAGVVGVIYVVRGVFTPTLDREASKTLTQILYGVVCFATLFSFVGTVLGGIWADYSWGRFWGWDPKENGAILIVIMNALILHARWGGLVKERGMAVLAMCGNMVTLWSWFGTNQLGIGLHAYGFNKDIVLLCRYSWLAQLALIGVGLLPLKWWRSFGALTAKFAPVRPPTVKPGSIKPRLRPA